MKAKKYFNLNDEFVDKIISVAYRDATFVERIKVMRAASQNEEVRKLLESYKETADNVKQLHEEDFSEEMIKNPELKRLLSSKKSIGFLSDLYSVIFARPVISIATTIILVATIVFTILSNRPVQYNYKYSESEIIKADLHARQALSIIGKIFKETQETLENEILNKRVSKPINNGIGIINNLFEGDIK